jgi:hypothetical protein
VINIEIITKEQLLKLEEKEKVKVLINIVSGKVKYEENLKCEENLKNTKEAEDQECLIEK